MAIKGYRFCGECGKRLHWPHRWGIYCSEACTRITDLKTQRRQA